MKREKIYELITQERERQHAKWGKQVLPMIHSSILVWEYYRTKTQKDCDEAAKNGNVTFEHILMEELAEVLAAKTPAEQKTELIQLAAVCVQILEGME